MYMIYALTKFLLSHGGQNHDHDCTISSDIEGEKGHVDSGRKYSQSPSTGSYEVAAKTTYEERPIIEMKEKLGERGNIPKNSIRALAMWSAPPATGDLRSEDFRARVSGGGPERIQNLKIRFYP
jgi:hypothetical protein